MAGHIQYNIDVLLAQREKEKIPLPNNTYIVIHTKWTISISKELIP